MYEQANFYNFKCHQHTQAPPPRQLIYHLPANLKATQRKNNSNDTDLSPIVKTYLIPTYLPLSPPHIYPYPPRSIQLHASPQSQNYRTKRSLYTNIYLPDVTLDRKKKKRMRIILDLIKQAKKNIVFNMTVPTSHGLSWTYLVN